MRMTIFIKEKIQTIPRAFIDLESRIEKEIKSSEVLIVFMYWAFFSFTISFASWINNGYTGKYSALPCWPHFSDCKDILPLTPLPYGYSETIFYTLLLSVITYGLYKLYQKSYLTAYYCLLMLWAWKAFVVSVTYGIANYDYYDLILIGVFLFLRDKKKYLRFIFVLLYFLASTIKIGPGWIDGSYFTSLVTGLPVLPDVFAPFVTNAVILFQMVGAWFLFSRNTYLYKFALGFFIFFHLYSTILVGYRYPLTALFCLIVLFGLEKERTYLKDLKPNMKTGLNYVLVIALFVLQFIGILIPGNQKMTLEGNNYGLYMFEANHQCVSSFVVHMKDGENITQTNSSADARHRCDPYINMWQLKKRCTPEVATISWTFDHSINGEPLYRIVDLNDVCTVDYRPFAHNDWINSNDPLYIANVHEDIYDLGKENKALGIFEQSNNGVLYIGNSAIEHDPIVQKTPLQEFIALHAQMVSAIYWVIWAAVLISVVIMIVA